MSDHKLQQLEDLAFTLLINNSRIETENGMSRVHFILEAEKFYLLENYLKRLRLINLITITEMNKNHYSIEPNLQMERIIRTTSFNTNEPKLKTNLFNKNIFILTICLFGEKIENQIILPSKLSLDMKNAIAMICKLKTNVTLEPNLDYFNIYDLNNLIEQTTWDRPLYETIQLMQLLNEIDFAKLLKSREQVLMGRRADYATN